MLTRYKWDERETNDKLKIALFKPFLLRCYIIDTEVVNVSFHIVLFRVGTQ